MGEYGYKAVQDYQNILNHLLEIKTIYERKFKTTSDKFSYEQQQTFIDHQKRWIQQNIDLLEKNGGTIELKMAQDLKAKELKEDFRR